MWLRTPQLHDALVPYLGEVCHHPQCAPFLPLYSVTCFPEFSGFLDWNRRVVHTKTPYSYFR